MYIDIIKALAEKEKEKDKLKKTLVATGKKTTKLDKVQYYSYLYFHSYIYIYSIILNNVTNITHTNYLCIYFYM